MWRAKTLEPLGELHEQPSEQPLELESMVRFEPMAKFESMVRVESMIRFEPMAWAAKEFQA